MKRRNLYWVKSAPGINPLPRAKRSKFYPDLPSVLSRQIFGKSRLQWPQLSSILIERAPKSFRTMSALSQPVHKCEVPASNGKSQPWKEAWPPRRLDLQDVAEAQGQMLLLDGTGGSGTKAVPNAVHLPPKSEKPQSDKKDLEDKSTAQPQEAKSEK